MFGSMAGPSWNSWMKDLVPEQQLGTYFASRSRYTQILNVILTLIIAFTIDYIKDHYPTMEIRTYAIMFLIGGAFGLLGSFLLSRVPEPAPLLQNEKIFSLFKKPLKDSNFRRLLLFNSGWVFALNIATPFFTVYMIKSLHLPLSYIIGLGILTQIASILTVKTWGTFADRYSNKTIIAISGPLYIFCIIAWCFLGLYQSFIGNIMLLIAIHVFSGVATAGVNLSVTNMGLKLSPSKHAIVYLSTKNIVTSAFASIAPIIGGGLADFFMNRSLVIHAKWTDPALEKVFPMISLHEWNFLFLIGAFLAIVALELLTYVKEVGEVERELVVRIMRTTLKSSLKDFFLIGTLISWHDNLWELIRRKLTVREKTPDPTIHRE
jgi:MFS family permease